MPRHRRLLSSGCLRDAVRAQSPSRAELIRWAKVGKPGADLSPTRAPRRRHVSPAGRRFAALRVRVHPFCHVLKPLAQPNSASDEGSVAHNQLKPQAALHPLSTYRRRATPFQPGFLMRMSCSRSLLLFFPLVRGMYLVSPPNANKHVESAMHGVDP